MPHPGKTLPRSLEPPFWCTYPPPQDWYPYWGGQKFACATAQYILYKYFCAWLFLYIFWNIPFASKEHPTFWVWLGSHMVAGIWLGKHILNNVMWHHMTDMAEVVDTKIKGVFCWPWLYLKFWLLFFIAGHC
jgi:hypothetical protein